MRTRRLIFWLMLFHISALSGALHAQAKNQDSRSASQHADRYANKLRHDPLRNEWSVWSGVSFDSPSGAYIGVTPGREFFVMAIQYGRTIASNDRVTLEYTIDFFPTAVVTKNPKIENIGRRFGDRGASVLVKEESVYGLGMSPVGLKFYFLQDRYSRFFFSASAGFLTFKETVPLPDARKFNFTFDFGGGIQIMAGSHWGLTLGYRLHHLSNANTANANPGLDANIFYLGISSFR